MMQLDITIFGLLVLQIINSKGWVMKESYQQLETGTVWITSMENYMYLVGYMISPGNWMIFIYTLLVKVNGLLWNMIHLEK